MFRSLSCKGKFYFKTMFIYVSSFVFLPSCGQGFWHGMKTRNCNVFPRIFPFSGVLWSLALVWPLWHIIILQRAWPYIWENSWNLNGRLPGKKVWSFFYGVERREPLIFFSLLLNYKNAIFKNKFHWMQQQKVTLQMHNIHVLKRSGQTYFSPPIVRRPHSHHFLFIEEIS